MSTLHIAPKCCRRSVVGTEIDEIDEGPKGRKGEIAAQRLVAARAAAPALFGARLGCAFRCQIGAEEADRPISPL